MTHDALGEFVLFTLVLVVGYGVGFGAGIYKGKSAVLERLFEDNIQCELTVNPITQEMIK